MTIDRSLRRTGRLARSRNDLKRGERIDQVKSEETWREGQSPLGLAKTRVVKAAVGKKKKKAKEEDAAAPAAAAPGDKKDAKKEVKKGK